jgi:hypothetical protein
MACVEEITITGTTEGRYAEILTPEAVAFVVRLDREFGAPPAPPSWTSCRPPRRSATTSRGRWRRRGPT